MKTRFFVLSLFGMINFLFAQSIPCIVYNAQVNASTDHGDDGKTTLHFANGKSLYVYNDWPTETSYGSNGGMVSARLADAEGMPIYTSLPDKQQVYKTFYLSHPKRPWILTEPIPTIEWDIQEDEKMFGALRAIAAVGEYGGRQYHVWFTPDIPLPLGPHRLNGLPGIILDAWSSDNIVTYTFEAYHPVCPTERKVSPPAFGNAVDYDTFRKLLINRLLKREAQSPPDYKYTIDDPRNPNYEVEQRKWTIFSEYKRKRGY